MGTGAADRRIGDIRPWHLLAAAGVLAGAVLVLLAMGRPPVAASGEVWLWAGEVQGPDNSQHLADWYAPSHVIHGFLFYLFGWLALRRRPVGERFVLAVAIEAAWEIVENTPAVIDRYREATMAWGYSGDSVVNSAADIGWMAVGFWIARVLPAWATVALAIGFELLTLALIRDNLTLNVLMLLAPVEAIAEWQAG